ncbi:MAG: DNA-directed DNA polymerase II small subunit [Candidatus Bathyarchaeota archaeon]|nr:MAG: DNA-directed DNA polymerase II small subunit [Candidatus Bathyarchaeota archaeon]
MNKQEKVKQAISLSLKAGYHLEKEAFNLLHTISKTEDPVKLIETTLKKIKAQSEKLMFISKDLLEEMAKEIFPENKEKRISVAPILEATSVKTGKAKDDFFPRAPDIKKDIKVLKDPTDHICSTGSIGEYLEYFQDRFNRIKKLIQQRMDAKDATSLREVFRAASNSKIKIICMITEKRESKNGIFLGIEDLECSTTVLVPSNAHQGLVERVKVLLPDQIVGMNIVKSKRKLLIVKELFFPDIPLKKQRRAKENVCAALISDLHVGSKEFMRKEFNRFVLWLNGKFGNENSREVASLVKYIIIAGDIVDGIGIYPNQIEELTEKDVFEQYKLAAKFLEQIPNYIEIIIIPGNHDASRRSLPQPALTREYIEPILETRDVLSLGNPATVSIHNLDFLIYHGRSLDDVLATAANMNFHSPERAMKLLLQGRHLAPVYGQRTSIAPEKRDFLVIEQVPDIFHAGHVHVMKYESYRGTLIINSGAWQRQTKYQRELGLDPTPGIIPVVNLKTLKVLPMDFA